MDILPEHLNTVKKILTQYLPPTCKIYVFGSRIKGNARKFSDLDLAIDNQGAKLSLQDRAHLEEAFQESSLPYKVDLLDWNLISDQFKMNIDKKVELTLFNH